MFICFFLFAGNSIKKVLWNAFVTDLLQPFNHRIYTLMFTCHQFRNNYCPSYSTARTICWIFIYDCSESAVCVEIQKGKCRPGQFYVSEFERFNCDWAIVILYVTTPSIRMNSVGRCALIPIETLPVYAISQSKWALIMCLLNQQTRPTMKI